MPDKPIKNFTTDWNDGTAIGALVDAIAPGLCPDWKDWNPKNAIKNAREALNAAQQWLDVPQASNIFQRKRYLKVTEPQTCNSIVYRFGYFWNTLYN